MTEPVKVFDNVQIRMGSISGSAFLTILGEDISSFATPQNDYKVRVIDSAGKRANGFLDVVYPAETLGPELMTNTGFETRVGTDDDGVKDGFTGWSTNSFLTVVVESVTAATIAPHGGVRCVRCSIDAYPGRITSSIMVDDYGRYRLSFWTRGDGINSGFWEVRFYSQSTLIASGHPGIKGTDWTYVEVDVDLPIIDGAISVNLRGEVGASGSVYFDDASFKKVTVERLSNTNLLSNADFETAGTVGEFYRSFDLSFDSLLRDIFSDWTEDTSAGGVLEKIEASWFHNGVRSLKATCGAADNQYSKVEQTFITEVGQFYKISLWASGDGVNAGAYSLYDVVNGKVYADSVSTGIPWIAWTQVNVYFTALSESTKLSLISPLVANGYSYFDEVSIKKVYCKEVAIGARITSTRGGFVQGWENINSGFVYSDTAYYSVRIYDLINRIPAVPSVARHGGDISIDWDTYTMEGDFTFVDGDLETDDGLRTSVIISLFSDRRAREDDALPDPASTDRRGWWGDLASPEVEKDEIGSRLWLLSREKTTPEVLIRAEQYAKEALQWMIEDGVAASVSVKAERLDSYSATRLDLLVEIKRVSGEIVTTKFDIQWQNMYA